MSLWISLLFEILIKSSRDSAGDNVINRCLDFSTEFFYFRKMQFLRRHTVHFSTDLLLILSNWVFIMLKHQNAKKNGRKIKRNGEFKHQLLVPFDSIFTIHKVIQIIFISAWQRKRHNRNSITQTVMALPNDETHVLTALSHSILNILPPEWTIQR